MHTHTNLIARNHHQQYHRPETAITTIIAAPPALTKHKHRWLELKVLHSGANIMVDAYEYCKPETLEKICRPGKMHLECGAAEKKPKYECQKVAPLLPMTKKVKRFLLDLHNGWRDKVASGEETGGKGGQSFPIATRMRELIWDNELNYLASNQGFKGKQDILSVFQIMVEVLQPIYDGKSDIVDTTNMANCSIEPGNNYRFCNYFVCNYDFENKPFEIVYQPGNEPASDCGHWGAEPSKKWPNLCTNTGERFKYVSISPDHPFGLG
uniref:SCP domain-containing protein n=1 Tax=Glossina pallidipes TaxID=7398 RepID=A0A1B0AB67_GLOPL